MIRLASASLAMLLALVAGGCGDTKPGDDGEGDGGSTTDGGGEETCASDSECADWEICEGDVCEDGDRNNSIDEAESMLWDDTTSGYINPAADVDYFALSAEGGEYVKITTTTDDDESNTVLTLRDPNRKVLTSSDEYPTGSDVSTFDSVIYAYLAEPGSYIIEVEDDGTYYGDVDHSTNGSKDYTYVLAVSQWTQATDEIGTFDGPSPALGIDSGSLYPVGVVLEEPGDTDYIGVSMPWGNTGMTVGGVADLSGSDLSPRVEIHTAEGVRVSSKVDVGPDGSLYYPAMEEGDYVITVTDEGGGGGQDHWTFLFVSIGAEDGAYDSEVEPNDSEPFANEMSMESGTSSAGDYIVGHFQGWTDGPGDVDYFAFPGFAGGDAVACLNSAKWGSAVVPDIEIWDSSETLLDSDAGNAASDPNAAIENVAVDDGTYYLAVRAPDDATGALDEWYRVTVYVAEFSIGSYTCP